MISGRFSMDKCKYEDICIKGNFSNNHTLCVECLDNNYCWLKLKDGKKLSDIL